MPSRPFTILSRVLWSGVVLGLLGYLALTLWIAFSGIFFPYQLDYGEGIVLWFTHELARGHSIYKGLEGLPYASNNYPPLATVLALPFQFLLGDSYIGGRWLNFAAALLTGAFIYRIVRAETRSRRAGALCALFFLGSTFVYHWIPLYRVDLIGLAFSVAGIFFVWKWEKEVTGRRSPVGKNSSALIWNLGPATIFFLCALYTKHSLFFAPAAAVVAIFLRERRAATLFAGALALSGGAIYLALDFWTRGGFTFGLVESNATIWLWSTFLPLVESFVQSLAVLLLLAMWGWWQRVRAHHLGVLEIYALTGLGSLTLAGRIGAYDNYLFEAVVVVCIFAGIALAPMLRLAMRAPMWVPLALLLQLVLLWRDHDPRIALTLFDWTRAGNLDVAPLVRAANGIVISEDMGLLVTNGKPVDYYTFQYSSLARAGKWNQRWELANLRAGNFPLVILLQGTREDIDKFRNFTREFASALDYGYALKTENVRYEVYAPAPLAHLRDDEFESKLKLIGWSLSPESARAGDALALSIVWRAEQKLNARYKTFAHLEEAKGGVVAQDDHEPKAGVYPTTNWAQDEMVREVYSLRLPSRASATYSLRVGWYNMVTQDRLTVENGADFVELTQVEIK